MTHDELRAVAEGARAEPMVTAHVLTLADGVLQLLAELAHAETMLRDGVDVMARNAFVVTRMHDRIVALEKDLAAMRLELMDRR